MKKKSKTMRAASFLLVLTLMTSCFVGSTFAKYTTSDTGTDTARVAKWGVTVKAKGTTFAKEYTTNNQAVVGTIAKSVISADNVLAPGTEGNMAGIEFRGTPEVATKVSYVVDLELGNNWIDADNGFYFPVILVINDTEYSAEGTNCTTADAFETYIEETIVGVYEKTYGPGVDLSNYSDDNLTISWKWPFSVNSENDKKDTFLGNRAAGTIDNAGTIDLTIIATVEQID